MINVKRISYYFIIMTADKKQYDITKMVQDGGWEEGKGELACHINGRVANERIGKKKVSSIIKNGFLIRVLVSTGGEKREVARGTLVDWEPILRAGQNDFNFSAYDDLYYLRESQDDVYFKENTKTDEALKKIFDEWKIPVGKYEGPSEKHETMKFRSRHLSDIVLEILKDAHTRGGAECIVRNVKGKLEIIPRGSNEKIYHFGSANTQLAQYRQTTTGMVTRVKVIGRENGDGQGSVDAVLDGDIQYGIRQKIYLRPNNKSLEDAKKEAQEILDESGKVIKTISLEAPDVPDIRKGDKVHVKAGPMNGYYYVLGIRHFCRGATMTMEIESV